MEEIKTNGKIYIIGDLHLSLNYKTNKSMEVFKGKWENYVEKIKTNWENLITNEDVVIVAGDISWAMTLDEAFYDLDFLNKLPGTKILLKGNHDYWWESKKKMEEYFEKNNFDTFKILYNNSYNIGDINIYGTKGWSFQEEGDFKNLRREGLRLKLSRDSIKNKDLINVCVTHYPPFLSKKDIDKIKLNEDIDIDLELENIDYVKIMQKINTKVCFYGHLHGVGHNFRVEGNKEGIYFKLISGDFIDFKPLCLNDILIEI